MRESTSTSAGRLRALWLTETLRLREALWGPLEDSREVRLARGGSGDFSSRIQIRAQALAQREGLDRVVLRWQQASRWGLILLMAAAILAGAAAALGVLGDGSRSVNILLALVAALGLHLLALLFWLLSFFIKDDGAGGIAAAWWWLTNKLVRGPDAALAPRALAELFARHHALRWLLGGVSHAAWALALTSLLLTLLALLAARQYTFHWETTLLSPDAFVHITRTLGWLPGKLGFAQPDAATIRASNVLTTVPGAAQALWSSWLAGCILVYGVAPRVLALLLCGAMLRRRLGDLRIDPGLPGHAELRDRLMPPSMKAGTDGAPPHDFVAAATRHTSVPALHGKAAVCGIELPDDIKWPPRELAPDIVDLGVIDSREQRRNLLDALHHDPPQRLLVICDGRQTPDRGTVALLAELYGLADDMAVAVITPADTTLPQPRRDAWMQRLMAAGLPDARLHLDSSPALAWLSGHDSKVHVHGD